jgi:hypothetical protein
MNIYHVWCDLKPRVKDIAFSEKTSAYLDHLKANGLIEDWRLTRRKLGLGPSHFGEFHVMIFARDMAQLDQAFAHAASRKEPVEGLHFAVNSLVTNATFALYRDFPDDVRQRGEEKF